MFCKDLNARGLYEQFADNPYLPEFYKNPERNAFPLEVSFLAERFRQMKDLFETPDLFQPLIISDYIFQKSLIFARYTLPEPEFLVFEKVFQLLNQSAPRPDVIVFLHRETDSLFKHIKMRGRPYEQEISADYLEKITKSYYQFFRESMQSRVVLVDADRHDFLHDITEREKLLRYLSQGNIKFGLNFYDEYPFLVNKF